MIACEGDPADYVFLVVKGTVRSCRSYQDGSRGIVSFHFAGELFGWSGEPVYSFSAEAVTDTLILFFRRKDLLSAAAQDSKIANYLLAATTNELRRVQEHSLASGRRAKSRMATFLMDLSARTGKPKYLKLPMPLHDIADHLGLKMETVSRTISALVKSGSIGRASISHSGSAKPRRTCPYDQQRGIGFGKLRRPHSGAKRTTRSAGIPQPLTLLNARHFNVRHTFSRPDHWPDLVAGSHL